MEDWSISVAYRLMSCLVAAIANHSQQLLRFVLNNCCEPFAITIASDSQQLLRTILNIVDSHLQWLVDSQ
jgi:hypothetical protein